MKNQSTFFHTVYTSTHKNHILAEQIVLFLTSTNTCKNLIQYFSSLYPIIIIHEAVSFYDTKIINGNEQIPSNMLLWINSSENIKLRGPCNAEFTEQGILISNNEWIESIQKYHQIQQIPTEVYEIYLEKTNVIMINLNNIVFPEEPTKRIQFKINILQSANFIYPNLFRSRQLLLLGSFITKQKNEIISDNNYVNMVFSGSCDLLIDNIKILEINQDSNEILGDSILFKEKQYCSFQVTSDYLLMMSIQCKNIIENVEQKHLEQARKTYIIKKQNRIRRFQNIQNYVENKKIKQKNIQIIFSPISKQERKYSAEFVKQFSQSFRKTFSYTDGKQNFCEQSSLEQKVQRPKLLDKQNLQSFLKQIPVVQQFLNPMEQNQNMLSIKRVEESDNLQYSKSNIKLFGRCFSQFNQKKQLSKHEQSRQQISIQTQRIKQQILDLTEIKCQKKQQHGFLNRNVRCLSASLHQKRDSQPSETPHKFDEGPLSRKLMIPCKILIENAILK